MKITRTEKKTEKLEDLEVGTVITLHNEISIYMVINEHDYYIDNKKLNKNEITIIDLEDGEILALDGETEVNVINGSFVIDN